MIPSHDHDGTNGLLFDIDDPPVLAYGPGNFERHMRAFSGKRPREMVLSSFGLDIDTRSDLLTLAAWLRANDLQGHASETTNWMDRHWFAIEERATR